MTILKCNHIGHPYKTRVYFERGNERHEHACSSCGQIYRQIAPLPRQTALGLPMPYGEHKNIAMTCLPISYLAWLSDSAPELLLRSAALLTLQTLLLGTDLI